jgi:hypothetical protein
MFSNAWIVSRGIKPRSVIQMVVGNAQTAGTAHAGTLRCAMRLDLLEAQRVSACDDNVVQCGWPLCPRENVMRIAKRRKLLYTRNFHVRCCRAKLYMLPLKLAEKAAPLIPDDNDNHGSGPL